jgi:hypothetical protein
VSARNSVGAKFKRFLCSVLTDVRCRVPLGVGVSWLRTTGKDGSEQELWVALRVFLPDSIRQLNTGADLLGPSQQPRNLCDKSHLNKGIIVGNWPSQMAFELIINN